MFQYALRMNNKPYSIIKQILISAEEFLRNSTDFMKFNKYPCWGLQILRLIQQVLKIFFKKQPCVIS